MMNIDKIQHDRILFTDGWSFQLNDTPCDNDYKPVFVPHDWQIHNRRDQKMPHGGSQGYYPRAGMGWYKNTLTVSEDMLGKTIYILFDGVQRFSTLYINGVEVGSKNYGYVPFKFDISDFIKYGEENIIVLKVDNSAGDNDRWYSGAGLYRNVWIITDEPTHIVPQSIKFKYTLDDNGDAECNVDFDIVGDDDCTCGVEIYDTEGVKVKGFCNETFNFNSPILWDIDNPYLYTVEITLKRDDEIIDTQTIKTGFRKIKFDGDTGFSLNDKNIKLHGVNLHHDGAGFGTAVPIRVWERRFKALKELGCNAIRCSHNPQAEEFYDLCDSMGFVVIDEVYDKWTAMYYNKFYMQDRFIDIKAMIDRDYNHPSIILWSVGNEVEDQYSEKFYTLLKEKCDKVRELDPSRPVSKALNGYNHFDYDDEAEMRKRIEWGLRYAEIVDVYMGNYMENFYKILRDSGMNKPIIGTEVFSYYRLKDLNVLQLLAQSPWIDVEDNAHVCGGFIWAGVDYLGESIAWPSHGWAGCPIDSAGMRKLRSWNIESQWKNTPVIKIGVYDENEPHDITRAHWSFPQMSNHWNFFDHSKAIHVGVMSNCELVKIYLNDRYIGSAPPEWNGDRMAHFYIEYNPGKLVAEGYNGGKLVAKDELTTSYQAEKLVMKIYEDTLAADGKDIIHVDVAMVDKYGQKWSHDRYPVTFKVEGPADIVCVNNGDFRSTEEIFLADKRTLFHGQVCATLRSRKEAGTIKITAVADGFEAVSETITSK